MLLERPQKVACVIMTKLLFAAVLLLAGARPGFAQGRDTAFAVHKLFIHKRINGQHSAASAVTEAATLNGAITGALVGTAPLVLGLRQAQRYSELREHEILRQHAAGMPIPADVRHALRRKYFHRTAQDVASAGR